MKTEALDYLLTHKCHIRRGYFGGNIQMAYSLDRTVTDESPVTLSFVFRLQDGGQERWFNG